VTRIARRAAMTTGGHDLTTIHGERINIHLAKIVYKCLYCLSDLEIKNHGLKCSDNHQHYGFIHRGVAKELTRGEIMKTMAELFPNQTGIMRGGIDLPDGAEIMTIKDVTAEDRRKFQSKDTETICLVHFMESPLKVRIPLSYGRILCEAYGPPGEWIGKRVKVFDNAETVAGKKMIVTRIQPTTHSVSIDVSKMTKSQLATHCKNTLKIWNPPYDPVNITRIMSYVLSMANLTGDHFRPQDAYDEMVEVAVPLHKFLNSLDDYFYGLEWLEKQYSEAQLAYSSKNEEQIRQSIFDSQVSAVSNPDEMDGTADYGKFEKRILDNITYFTNGARIETAMAELNLRYDPANEEFIYNELANFANQEADSRLGNQNNSDPSEEEDLPF